MPLELEFIHTGDDDPKWNMPYTPAIKVTGGSTIYVAGVTAGPVYHSHPHVLAEFESIPTDPAEQAEMALDNLENVLAAAGATLDDVVQMFRFIVDIDRTQDALNKAMGRRMSSRATSTTVEVTRLASAPGLWFELTAVAVVDQ